jgi:hypothetical protein
LILALSKGWCGIRRDNAANTIKARENAAKKISVHRIPVSITVNIALMYGDQSAVLTPDAGWLYFPHAALVLPFPLRLQGFGVLDS